jgi:hypothetical protein
MVQVEGASMTIEIKSQLTGNGAGPVATITAHSVVNGIV